MAGPEDRAEKAAAAYAEVETGTIRNLMQAVKAAQAQKQVRGKKLGRKAQRAVAAATKVEIQQEQAQQVLEDTAEVLEAEAARLEDLNKFEAQQVEQARRREQRLKSVEAGRRLQQLQVAKVKQLQRTLNLRLAIAQKGTQNQQTLKELLLLQQSVKSAWAALPSKLRHPEDAEAIKLNDKILEDLTVIAAQEQADREAKARFVKNYNVGYVLGNMLGRGAKKLNPSKQLAAAAMAGRTRLQQAGHVAGGVGAAIMRAPSAMFPAVTARRLVSGVENIGTRLGDLGRDTKSWFTKKFGGMFSRLWGVIRNPLGSLKSGASLFGKAIGWGVLFSTVLGPLLKGLYDELTKNFSLDTVATKFDEVKTWLTDKITGWFRSFFGKDKENEVRPTLHDMGRTHNAQQEQKAWDAKASHTPLEKLERSYRKFTDAGSLTGSRSKVVQDVYRREIQAQLATISPGSIPNELRTSLLMNGFTLPQVSTSGSATVASPATGGTATSATTPTVATVTSPPVIAGPPADGQAASPITARPAASTSAESSGPSSGGSTGSPSGLAVGQIPRHVGDESTYAYNVGMLATG